MASAAINEGAGIFQTIIGVLKSCMTAPDRLVEGHAQDAAVRTGFEELLPAVRRALRTSGEHHRRLQVGEQDPSLSHLLQQLHEKSELVRTRAKGVLRKVKAYPPSGPGKADLITEIEQCQFLAIGPGEAHIDRGACMPCGSCCRCFWRGCCTVLQFVHRRCRPQVYQRLWQDVVESVEGLKNAVSQADEAFLHVRNLDARAQSVPLQAVYVRPRVFQDVVDSLLQPHVRIVVLYGQLGLGRSELVKNVCSLARSEEGALAEAFQEAMYYMCEDGYLCNVEGKPSQLDKLHARVTGVREDLYDEAYVQGLEEHMADPAHKRLLVLDNLDRGRECFGAHGHLASLLENLQASESKILIACCSNTVSEVLPQGRYVGHMLSREDNEANVMDALMGRLAAPPGPEQREEAEHGLPQWRVGPFTADEAKLLEAVRSCVDQCQGSPSLLRFVDKSVRRNIGPPGQFTLATIDVNYTAVWQACADGVFQVPANVHGGGRDDHVHSIYLNLVQQVAEGHGLDVRHPLGSSRDQISRAVRGVLRTIAFQEHVQVFSKAWYWWDQVQSHLALQELEHPGTDRTPMVERVQVAPVEPQELEAGDVEAGDADDDVIILEDLPPVGQPTLQERMSRHGKAVTNQALLQLAEGGLLEMRTLPSAAFGDGAGSRDPRVLRFHELLRLCLTTEREPKDRLDVLIGQPPAPASASLQRQMARLHRPSRLVPISSDWVWRQLNEA